VGEDHRRTCANRARVGPSGEPILLLDQNRAHWDPLLSDTRSGTIRRRGPGTTRGVRIRPFFQSRVLDTSGSRRARQPADLRR
jgi:hypothetical protein